MSSLKNIFRSSTKDSNNKRTSVDAESLRPSPIPTIDVTDTASQVSEETVTTSKLKGRQTFDDPASLAGMPRLASSGHGQWRSEGGKTLRKGSKVEKSDDAHGKPELLNRHELMRRAMATAQDPSFDNTDDEQPPTPVAPGEGSLSIDAFQDGQNHVIASDSGLKLRKEAISAPSKAPTIVTPSPVRAEIPRSDSLEDVINQGLPPNKAQTMMEQGNLIRPDINKSMSATHLGPDSISGFNSASLQSPGPFSRLRKSSNSDLKASRKGGGPAGEGIAGALAASGMAGMGVGHAAAIQQGQAAAAMMNNNKRADGVASLGHQFPAHTAGYQGGIYRDPSTGTVIEKDHQGNDFIPQRPSRDRSVSSLVSYDGSVASERSSASGLGAAAGFGAASASLIAPIGGAVPGAPGNGLLAPDGSIGSGSISPAMQGPEGGILDSEIWGDDMGPQITGFAVASSKRNHDFHALFSSVPEDDYLIEDYGCALLREILIQGRIYISENHICFNANIFGWVTNIVLPFSEIVSIEKRMTAFVIPNAIQITTLHAKNTFTSFLARDTTYDLVINIWKLSHPGVTLSAADQAELTDEYSEVEDGDSNEGGNKDSKPSKRARLKRKLIGTKSGVRDENLVAVAAAAARSGTPIITPSRSPAPETKREPHRKTSCPCEKHLPTIVLDTTYPAVPEKIYNLLFTSGFMKDFWNDNQKLLELQISDWSPNAQNNNMLSRSMSYIKPLSGGFGPKQTKCLLTDENLHVDFDDYVTMLTTTRTPDVPSGGSFAVKTRTCISWAGGNVTKVLVSCTVDWSGRSMIKSIIDKASIDGQRGYYKDLDGAVRTYLQEHISEFKEEGDDQAAVEEIKRQATPGPQEKKEQPTTFTTEDIDQGNGILNMVYDIVSDLISGANINNLLLSSVIIVLLLSNIYTWTRTPKTYHPSLTPHQPDPVAAAVREVLKDFLQPKATHDGSDDFLTQLREAEERVEKLKLAVERMKTDRLIAA